jgi:membrane peptidoglycan carboxypeptidase
MGNTRPLPQREAAPGPPRPRQASRARRYLKRAGITLAMITVTQGAMLAGVVNAPSVDDPINDPASARTRLEHVIGRMAAVGYLTGAQAARALSAPLGLVARDRAGC